MHIAFNAWFWDQPHTGSGQYLRQLVTALTKLKAELRLTLVIPTHAQAEDIPTGVEVVQASAWGGGDLGKVWFEQRAYSAAVKRLRADIAHVPYWAGPLNSSARLVISILDVIPLAIPAYSGGLRAKLYTSLVTASAQGAGHILTLSHASQADITRYIGIPAEQITVTPLAADERFSAVPQAGDEAVRQKYYLPDEFALYLGGFDLRKNVNTLLLAWTYVGQPMGQQVPLVLAGRPPQQWGTSLFPDLPDYARQLKIDPYLIWVGAIDEADKPALYRLAKVFIYPSHYEGFGLPILEAMASGTPVVAANSTSIPELTGEAAYLVDPENARDMAGAILALLVQDDLHHSLANAGRGQATQFNWRKTAQATLEVYQQVMKA
jgi:glycosyltransferase involved in cell wall biosynthesis